MPRLEPDVTTQPFTPPVLTAAARVLPVIPDDELETPPLPREHPKWVKDAVAVSHRARTVIAGLRPVMVRVLTFWDHGVHALTLRGLRFQIDSSGSYRFE